MPGVILSSFADKVVAVVIFIAEKVVAVVISILFAEKVVTVVISILLAEKVVAVVIYILFAEKVVSVDGRVPIRSQLPPMAWHRQQKGWGLGLVNSNGDEW